MLSSTPGGTPSARRTLSTAAISATEGQSPPPWPTGLPSGGDEPALRENQFRGGLLITIRRSKTDQERAGTQVAAPYARASNRCAVRALRVVDRGGRDPPRGAVSPDRCGDTITERRLSDL